MNFKFKVGDKVKIKEDLKVNKIYNEHCFFLLEMNEHKGKEATITGTYTSVCDEDLFSEEEEKEFFTKGIARNYLLDIDGKRNYWSADMLDPIMQEDTITASEIINNILDSMFNEEKSQSKKHSKYLSEEKMKEPVSFEMEVEMTDDDCILIEDMFTTYCKAKERPDSFNIKNTIGEKVYVITRKGDIVTAEIIGIKIDAMFHILYSVDDGYDSYYYSEDEVFFTKQQLAAKLLNLKGDSE